ncbi:MAG: cyclic peptide export ABC transporter [Opitutaceae bacterium]
MPPPAPARESRRDALTDLAGVFRDAIRSRGCRHLSTRRMEFIRFLKRESGAYGTRIAVVTVAGGIVNGLMVMIVLGAAGMANQDQVSVQYLVLFALALVALMLAKRYSLNHTTRLTEEIVERLRVRMADKIRRAELLYFENIGQPEFMTILSKETQVISGTASMTINATSSAVMLIVSFAFVAYLSMTAFFLALAAIAVAVLTFNAVLALAKKQHLETMRVENEFFDLLNHLLSGFKELKIDAGKNRDFFDHYLKPRAHDVRMFTTRTSEQFVNKTIITHSAFYVLLATVIFVLPRLATCEPSVVIKVTAVMLFIFGPLAEVVGVVPQISRASVSVETIKKMEESLDQEVARHPPVNLEVLPAPLAFREIKLDQIQFSYPDNEGAQSYTLGPLDATIHAGEILFIMGGNGSGKSTLLKLLTGLYFPRSGRILVDGKPLLQSQYHRYRNMFSAVFTDFHLFDRLYGQDQIEQEQVDQLLAEMELDAKTRMADGRFTQLNLSTGQRKRLALIVALLGNKNVLVFDEWAADQDPSFRKHFYETILPHLKSEGRTIIAATHDDRYFHVADRVFKMEWGRFVPSGLEKPGAN